MKLFKSYIPVILAVVATMFSSCLKNQEDIFDQSSNIRMQEYLDNAKAVLTAAPQGWIFDYAPDRNMSYGLILYTLDFNEKEVTVKSAIAPGETETSLYKLTNDNGPCLSFDSYNALMHFYATPSWSEYQAKDGDFEFVIMDVQPDKITLKGKRTGNFMYMTRLEEDADSYIQKSLEAAENQFLVRARGTVAGKSVSAFINLDVNRLELTVDGETEPVGAYFAFSPNGLRFPQPLEFGGASIEYLDYSYDDQSMAGEYTSPASAGAEVKLNTYIPDDYTFIDEFAGAFLLNFGSSTVNCILEPNATDGTVLIKNLNQNYNILATYSKAHGNISITAQDLAKNGDNDIKLCSGAVSGFFSAPNMAAIQFTKNPEKPNTFVASPAALPKAKETGMYMCLIEFIDGAAYYASDAYRIDGAVDIEFKSLIKK
ncbi:MAG: DUF4302 domain-containing protein [Bacteroidales bacterium]|nr:DUF4302 domain-containing protein [Bacteroidales bacterium]